jgi:hypothetical protein
MRRFAGRTSRVQSSALPASSQIPAHQTTLAVRVLRLFADMTQGVLKMDGAIHHKDRRLEWSLAAGTFSFGIWLADGSRSMDSDAYLALRSWLYESDWALLFLITGALHMVALGINGRAWWTPFVRSAVTAINALVYASFASGFWLIDASSTAVFMYSWACTQALLCIYGAVKDVSRVWRAWLNERK